MLCRDGTDAGLAATSCTPVKKSCSAGDNPAAGVSQHIVDLADLRRIGLKITAPGLRRLNLIIQKLAVDTLDRIDIGALPEKARAGIKRRIGALHDLLAIKARRACIGDVMARSGQPGLRCPQPRDADTENSVAHFDFLWLFYRHKVQKLYPSA